MEVRRRGVDDVSRNPIFEEKGKKPKGKKGEKRKEEIEGEKEGRCRVRNTIVGGGAAGSGVRGPFQPKQTLGN